MTIETKFNYNDEVWYMFANTATKDKISEFLIECKYSGGSAYGWGSSSHPISISYLFTAKDHKGISIHESKCFPSKEALLQSL